MTLWSGPRRNEDQFHASFVRNRALILQAAERALKGGRVTPDNRIHLRGEDFPRGTV